MITNLLFTDNNILFGDVTLDCAKEIKGIFSNYELVSGQCINFNKSTVFYSSNTGVHEKDEVAHLLGVRVSANAKKYLGFPNFMGRNKCLAFQSLKDRLHQKINS